MKTSTIYLENIKDSDGWVGLAYDVAFEKFKQENPELEGDKMDNKFYEEVIYPKFEYGEYGNVEIIVDENFNIIGGKIY